MSKTVLGTTTFPCSIKLDGGGGREGVSRIPRTNFRGGGTGRHPGREGGREREGFKLKRSGNGGGAVIDKKRSIDYWAGLKRGRALLYPRGEREK